MVHISTFQEGKPTVIAFVWECIWFYMTKENEWMNKAYLTVILCLFQNQTRSFSSLTLIIPAVWIGSHLHETKALFSTLVSSLRRQHLADKNILNQLEVSQPDHLTCAQNPFKTSKPDQPYQRPAKMKGLFKLCFYSSKPLQCFFFFFFFFFYWPNAN